MRCNQLTSSTIVVVSVVLHAHGIEVVGDTKDIRLVNDHQDLQFDPEILKPQKKVVSRLLENDEGCATACDEGNMNRFLALLPNKHRDMATDDANIGGFFSGIVGRVVGFFNGSKSVFRRWTNGLVNVFIQRQEDDPTSNLLSEMVVPLLSNYSTKFKSLAELLRQQNYTDSALFKTPNAIQMMLNMSAENMDFVGFALDRIVDDMMQQKDFDGPSTICGFMEILTLIHDITFPNVQLITQLIYTNSGNAEMEDSFNDYIEFSESAESQSYSAASDNEGNMCLYESSRTTTARRFGISEFAILGPIRQVFRILLLIALLPLSLVVSFLGAVLFVIVSTSNGIFETSCDNCLLLLVVAIVPILLLRRILLNIRDFFGILEPFLPELFPPPAYATYLKPTATPQPVSIPKLSFPTSTPLDPQQEVRNVMHYVTAVLDSPMETIVTLLQRKISEPEVGGNAEDEELDCAMATLKCNNDALLDALPF